MAFDLGTRTGWAMRHVDGSVRWGHLSLADDRGGGVGFRYLRFRGFLTDTKARLGDVVEAVFYERVDFVTTVEAARSAFGFEATLTSWCEHHRVPYRGYAVPEIKAFVAKGNAKKAEVAEALRREGFDVHQPDEADALACLLKGLDAMARAERRVA